MSLEIILMFTVLLLTVVLFMFEIFPMDKIAFFIIVLLILLGLVTPEEGISGFSNSATIAVLALMILAIAMEENGVISWLTSGMSKVSFCYGTYIYVCSCRHFGLYKYHSSCDSVYKNDQSAF